MLSKMRAAMPPNALITIMGRTFALVAVVLVRSTFVIAIAIVLIPPEWHGSARWPRSAKPQTNS
jgi:hypothetical protein